MILNLLCFLEPQIETNNENDYWVFSIEGSGNERQLIRYNENDGSGFNSPNHNINIKKLSWKGNLIFNYFYDFFLNNFNF